MSGPGEVGFSIFFHGLEIAKNVRNHAAVMLGYLWYVTAHYGMHHWRIRPASHLGRLRRRHALHHHFDDLGNFGVTSGFWDHVFRTNIES
jgi:sterol desaturase/sphingolipid hydroxylase (fatty acid hydroxylase superfamily)